MGTYQAIIDSNILCEEPNTRTNAVSFIDKKPVRNSTFTVFRGGDAASPKS